MMLFRKICLGLFLMTAPILGIASVLSDLAASLAPGEFVELEISGSVSTCDAMVQPLPTLTPTATLVPDPDHDHSFITVWDPYPPSRLNYYGNILEFTDEAQWYPETREVYIMGTRRPYQRWDQGFVKYTEATNSWTILDLPSFGIGAHGYDNAAMDVSRGHFYWSRIGQSRIVWRMDMSTNVWQQLDNAPIQSGQFSALEFFPELDRMVFFDGRVPAASKYALYNPDPEIESWESPVTLPSDRSFGGISHFSEYNQDRGMMFFGGGFHYSAGGTIPDPTPEVDELRRFYMLDSNKVVTRLADPPTFLGQTGAGPVQTIDPNTGNLVVFQGASDDRTCLPNNAPYPIWEYDLDTDTWRQTGEQRLSSLYCSMDTVAVPLYDYGVIFIVSVKSDTNCKVHLYKHSPGEDPDLDITLQPASVTVAEGQTANFSVGAVGSSLSYQWRKNGDPIDSATMASYSFTVLNLADQGAAFDVIVTDTSGSLTSSEAILTIEVDTLPPVISSALAGDATSIDIVFNEAITLASAQIVANYQISAGIQVESAVLNANNKTVHLQTDTLAPDTVYTLAVSSIQDASTAANEIAPGSTIEVVYTPSMGFDNGELPFGWTPLTASRWLVVIENGNNALFLNTTGYQALFDGRLGEHITSPDSYTDFTFTVDAKTNEPAGNTNADYALVFGFQNGNNYYYMLFNRTQDNTQLFRVKGGERQLLKTATDSGLTNDDYNTVTITRVGEAIEVSFGGNTVLQANDGTFATGKVGLGSFNDSAYFDNIRITAGSGVISDLVFADEFE
ncbi:MAG: hypothetical protein L3J24_14920 [Xanthomonadales bacterium]|nr:hypothetical protein [Xanthomonadales bacterium]